MWLPLVAALLTVVLFTCLTACDSASFTSNIHRHRRIDPRLAFRLESSTFSMEDDSQRLLRRTPWRRLLVW